MEETTGWVILPSREFLETQSVVVSRSSGARVESDTGPYGSEPPDGVFSDTQGTGIGFKTKGSGSSYGGIPSTCRQRGRRGEGTGEGWWVWLSLTSGLYGSMSEVLWVDLTTKEGLRTEDGGRND